MAKKAIFTFKKILAVLGIAAIMLAFVGFMAYVYILPTFDPTALFDKNKIAEAPERERMYEITDEFIDTYYGIEWKSELDGIGSEEELRAKQETLKKDLESFQRLDPLHPEGSLVDAYMKLSISETRLMERYLKLYEEEPEEGWDTSLGTVAYDIPSGAEAKPEDFLTPDEQWEGLIANYEAYKAADAKDKDERGE